MSYSTFKAHRKVAELLDRERGEQHSGEHRFWFRTTTGEEHSFPTIKACEDHVIRRKAQKPDLPDYGVQLTEPSPFAPHVKPNPALANIPDEDSKLIDGKDPLIVLLEQHADTMAVRRNFRIEA